MGNLNDVAWSHTSRLFSTFPATMPLIRFPQDYVFRSMKLKLSDIGSDHFRLHSSFGYWPAPAGERLCGRKRDREKNRISPGLKNIFHLF